MFGQFGDRILLGILQGVTEFLPISSSGHLVLAKKLLNDTEISLLNDVFIHFATVLAVITVYRRELWDIIKDLFHDVTGIIEYLQGRTSFRVSSNSKLVYYVIIGTIPAGVAGLLCEEMITQFFERLAYVGIFLLITGAILISTYWKPKQVKPLSLIKAFLIGCAQMIALFPGISRSGITISTGLWFGVTAREAVKFSFFMAIPVIIGANLLEFSSQTASLSGREILLLGASGIAAYISGIIAIKLLMKIINTGKFFVFGIYCVGVGIGVISFIINS